MASDDQLDLELEDTEDFLQIEDLTINADRLLAKAIGQFEHVFILGVDKNGMTYQSDHHDTSFWLCALERARDFIKRT